MEQPFTVEHVKEGNYILVRIRVPITRDVADESAQKGEEERERLGSVGILADVRGAPSVDTVHNNYEFSTFDLPETCAEFQPKRAILVDADDDSHDITILAMQQAGFNVKKFTDEQEAVTWLTGQTE